MGVAAYNRGSQSIANGIERDFPIRPVCFDIMDRVNSIPKVKNINIEYSSDYSIRPFSDKCAIIFSHGVWWLFDSEEVDGFGYWYPSLEKLISVWDIYLTEYNETTNIWYAE